MSKTRMMKSKRKFMEGEIMDNMSGPLEHQEIVRIVSVRGNHIMEVQTANDERYLVSNPTKFRYEFWIKRDSFVIVEPIAEGNKIKGEISRLLYPHHIQHFKKIGLWPECFNQKLFRGREEWAQDVAKNERQERMDRGEVTESSSSSSSESEED